VVPVAADPGPIPGFLQRQPTQQLTPEQQQIEELKAKLAALTGAGGQPATTPVARRPRRAATTPAPSPEPTAPEAPAPVVSTAPQPEALDELDDELDRLLG